MVELQTDQSVTLICIINMATMTNNCKTCIKLTVCVLVDSPG